MGLKIYWTNFSKKELQKIFEYYKENGSLKIARKLVGGITQETKILQKQFQIGQKEELLIDRKQEFRYLVYKNYKIIYWLNSDKKRIEIVDVFDARQNPTKIKRVK